MHDIVYAWARSRTGWNMENLESVPSISSYEQITELLDDEDLIDTTMSLRCCQDRVLKQYNRLLILAAWRPFFKENLSCPSWFLRGLNVLYALIVVALMLFFTVIQVLTCQGKLSVTDVTAQFTSDPIPSPTPEEVITPSVNVSGGTNFFAGPITPTALNEHRPPENVPPPCAHIIPTYILPAVLHFSAYIFGFYLFRIQENEQLYSLMEKVFIQARSTSGTQEKLIFNSRVYLFVSIVWISLHIGLDVLYLEAYKNDKKCSLTLCTIPAFKYIVLVIRFMGLFLVRMVSVAVVLNYGVQCEMLVMYIQGLTQRLREKTVEIRKAMHEILGLREFIGIMNSSLGMIASLCIVAFMELSILGMCLMILNKDMRVIVWAYRIMFSVLWITALVFPLVQAARVYSWGKRFRQIALEMRVFGYQTYSQLELDSFVLFVSNATLKVKLFGVTIQPATLVMTFGVAAFVLLLLIVTDVVTIAQSDYLF